MVKMVATWSKDPSTKCGAVIVDNRNRVVSVGFNGFPPRVADTKERYENKAWKYGATLHAEENAILNAGRSTIGCRIYTNNPPCSNCAARIIQAGLVEVIVTNNALPKPWLPSIAQGKTMLDEAKIPVRDGYPSFGEVLHEDILPDRITSLPCDSRLCKQLRERRAKPRDF